MKDIKQILSVTALLFAFLGCEKVEQELYQNEDGRFVRFTLMVNSNGELVDNSHLNPQASITSDFYNQKKETLAVPVSITSEPLDQEVTVNFSTEILGDDYSGLDITPANELSFSGKQLTDTIFIQFNERWNEEAGTKIKLRLESASDQDIQIGMPNDNAAFNELTIHLEKLILRYYFPVNNQVEINGEKGEEVEFDVHFPDGFFTSEIENTELISAKETGFDYTLERLPLVPGDNKISYKLKVDENLSNNNFTYTSIFELAELENYYVAGNQKITITKPELIERDLGLNTAAHFYNVDDPFYRIYGENWLFDEADEACEWKSFNTFTTPVVVDADNPNAVLFDDRGTENPNDDIYHHAFRVGFVSPNVGRTTNPFNLKRWFENESTDADNSPGFNIQQAIEFYPADGTNATHGQVRVIPQDLLIAGRGENSYFIKIEGEGDYEMIQESIFKITLELRATNEELFGGTQTSKYIIYNTDQYPEPERIPDNCITPMNL